MADDLLESHRKEIASGIYECVLERKFILFGKWEPVTLFPTLRNAARALEAIKPSWYWWRVRELGE